MLTFSALRVCGVLPIINYPLSLLVRYARLAVNLLLGSGEKQGAVLLFTPVGVEG